MDNLQDNGPDAPETADEVLEGIAREEAPDPLTVLEREVAMLRGQSEEYLDDLINQRRRHERERAELQGSANARLITQLLPVLDDFERATRSMPAGLESAQWAEGILLIARKIKQIFESEGVQEIPAAPGTPFDPNVHEAIMQEASQEFEPGQIVEELQKGYKMGERVLRASKVKVAR